MDEHEDIVEGEFSDDPEDADLDFSDVDEFHENEDTTDDDTLLEMVDTGLKQTQEIPVEPQLSMRDQILMEIEELMTNIMNQLAESLTPSIHTHDVTGIRLTERLRMRFAYIMRLLSEVYSLVLSDQFCTKRDIYYRNKSLYTNQANLNQALTFICQFLRHSRLDLHILSVAKGLVYGSLEYNILDTTVQCNEQYVQIPSRIDQISRINSNALYILVVEKEAVFTRLISEKFYDHYPQTILITGKGYPDLCTRQMLKLLVETLCIPPFCLVDADPHGLEILCTYKYGPRVKSYESLHMQVPSLIYLGVKRTEIHELPVPLQHHLTLTNVELTKIEKLKSRSEIMENAELMDELIMFESSGTKLEIEAVSSLRPNYLASVYLPKKLRQFIPLLPV